MILLFGALADSGIAYIVHRLLGANAPFRLLDTRRFLEDFELEWETDGADLNGRLRCGGESVPLAGLRSIYVHNLTPPAAGPAPDSRPAGQRAFWIVHEFLETAPVPVCNRPSACATNYSKTWQQRIIESCGFPTPRTLATNDPEAARAFYERCRRRVIYKSLSAKRSIVKRMTDGDLDRLAGLRSCPTQFQEWIPGTDIRVHVVGRAVFPTEIDTEAVDYRYSGRDGLPRAMRGVELPAEVARRCATLAETLGLLAAGVDLRRHLDGRYYCFEVNPTPAFMFYQQYTGQRIGDAVADLLLGAGAQP